jgi:hypothetical protein
MNIMVGPNNSGKSTIIDAFRLLSAGLRVAWYRTPQRFLDHEGIERFGYRVPVQLLPVTTENAHTDYDSEPALVSFVMSSGDELRIYFPSDEDDCLLLLIPRDAIVRSVSQFRSRYPAKIVTLPVLGPLEHRERRVTRETLNENLATRRASRSFRNFWYAADSPLFEEFRELIRETWPGTDIRPPELAVGEDESWIAMYFLEDRLTREMYWAGFGFQVWCQLLTHLLRADDASLIAVDEADLYLHPDLQRQLLALLRRLGPDIVVATHSSELTAEADPEEVLLVDKRLTRARRVTNAEGVRAALISLGSNRSLVLTQLARTKKGFLVEGEDFKLLRQFARMLGFDRLATGLDFAVVPLGGFRDPRIIRSIAEGMSIALGENLSFAVLLDRDYRPAGEAERVSVELQWAAYAHVFQRKELENYLLVPSVLDAAIRRACAERANRTSTAVPELPPAAALLEDVTEPWRERIHEYVEQGIAEHERTRAAVADVPPATFEQRWHTLESRLEMVPGKAVLSDLNALLQSRFQISLTTSRIVSSFQRETIPREVSRIVSALDDFRTSQPVSDRRGTQTIGPLVRP